MLILASASPRRKEILTMLGYRFTVCVSDADETIGPDAGPDDAVAVLSERKTAAVAEKYPDDVVLGSDTVVFCEGEILGKPENGEDAKAMLRLLSGRMHQVFTGITVKKGIQSETRVIISEVKFLPLSEETIDAYVKTGEPLDKAGAYAVQGRASGMIESIRGDFFAIMGLPSAATVMMLKEFGIEQKF